MTVPNKHTSRDKRLLALEREANRLYLACRDAPVIPLERPYQKGWMRSFALSPDVRRRPDSQVFAKVLGVVNRRQWCIRREFAYPDGAKMVLRPAIITPREWMRLRWPASHRRLFAFGNWEEGDAGEFFPRPWFLPSKIRRRVFRTGYAVHRPWWLCEVVWPHLITHQRVRLPEIETRLAEIEAELEHAQGRHRLSWLHGRRVRWRGRFSFAELCEAERSQLHVDT